VDWIDKKEQQTANVESTPILDDSVEKATIDLCRFYSNLIALSLIDATSDIETAEMSHFALQHSHLEEANTLYRQFTVGRL